MQPSEIRHGLTASLVIRTEAGKKYIHTVTTHSHFMNAMNRSGGACHSNKQLYSALLVTTIDERLCLNTKVNNNEKVKRKIFQQNATHGTNIRVATKSPIFTNHHASVA